MDSNRRPDGEDPQRGDQPAAGQADGGHAEPAEDRAAILSRRAFLIESALASAGITVGIAGCGPSKKEAGPQVCLSVPQECLKVAAPRDAGAAKPAPRVCLEAPRPTVCLQPQVCLSLPAPRRCLSYVIKRGAPAAPRKCLSLPRPDGRRDDGVPRPCLSRPQPRPCLSVSPTKKPSPRICLSPIDLEGEVEKK